MSDPRPVLWLLILQLFALAGSLGWWVLQPFPQRLMALAAIRQHEAIATEPPLTLQHQAYWLMAHRLGQLKRMRLLGIVAFIIGGCEGMARRRRDVLGGFLLRWWTIAVLCLPLLLGGIAGYLLLPIVLPAIVVGTGLSALGALTGYGLFSGRPAIS